MPRGVATKHANFSTTALGEDYRVPRRDPEPRVPYLRSLKGRIHSRRALGILCHATYKLVIPTPSAAEAGDPFVSEVEGDLAFYGQHLDPKTDAWIVLFSVLCDPAAPSALKSFSCGEGVPAVGETHLNPSSHIQ